MPTPPKQRIERAIKFLERIVTPEGIDAGVILKSSESPTEIQEVGGKQLSMYKHECFSDLGDHLVALWHILKDQTPESESIAALVSSGNS